MLRSLGIGGRLCARMPLESESEADTYVHTSIYIYPPAVRRLFKVHTHAKNKKHTQTHTTRTNHGSQLVADAPYISVRRRYVRRNRAGSSYRPGNNSHLGQNNIGSYFMIYMYVCSDLSELICNRYDLAHPCCRMGAV